MGIVQRIPRGYLSLIGAQTSGRNPDVATEEVRPTIDMTRYYDGYFVDFESLSFVANAAGVTHNIDVPAAETWILLGMSMTEIGRAHV